MGTVGKGTSIWTEMSELCLNLSRRTFVGCIDVYVLSNGDVLPGDVTVQEYRNLK